MACPSCGHTIKLDPTPEDFAAVKSLKSQLVENIRQLETLIAMLSPHARGPVKARDEKTA